MSVDATLRGKQAETLAAELGRITQQQTTSTAVERGVQALTAMLTERLRPGPQGSQGLGAGDVEALQKAAEAQGPEVAAAFRQVLAEALHGSVVVLDDAVRAHLETLAGESELTDVPVRVGLDPTAEEIGSEDGQRAQNTMLQKERWRMEGAAGFAGSKKSSGTPDHLDTAGRILQSMRVGVDAGDMSVAQETVAALGPEIEATVRQIGSAVWADAGVKSALRSIATDPSTARKLLPGLAQDTSNALCTALGVKAVNEEVVKHGLQLLPSIGKKLGIEGVEATASKIGKVLLKEGAEEAVEAGAKQGVKKGVMGLLSSIPLANTIPMLFTGGEVLSELTHKPPDKRVLGKGLATFALQIGALAFPPLGLAAAGVDLTGSVAIAVADGQKEGLTKAEREAKAKEAMNRHADNAAEMKEAIAGSSDVIAQALLGMEGSLLDLGADDRAAEAHALADRAKALDPEDEEAARLLQNDIGHFAAGSLLPEMVTQVRGLENRDPEDRSNWKLMGDGLSQIGAAITNVRRDDEGYTDPPRNRSLLKAVIGGIFKCGVAGTALAREQTYAGQVVEDT